MAELSIWTRFLEASVEDVLLTLYIDAHTEKFYFCELFLVVPIFASRETSEKILTELLFLCKMVVLGHDFFRKYTATQIHIRTHRNSFLRWCLLFPSHFFGDFVGTLEFTFLQIGRYADKVCLNRLLLNKKVSKIDLLVSAIVHDHGGSTGK
jgi:hypothetical protein